MTPTISSLRARLTTRAAWATSDTSDTRAIWFAAAVGLLVSPAAQAHPGDHGLIASVGDAVRHLLAEPDHLAVLALAVAVGVLAWRRRSAARRAPRAVPVASTGQSGQATQRDQDASR